MKVPRLYVHRYLRCRCPLSVGAVALGCRSCSGTDGLASAGSIKPQTDNQIADKLETNCAAQPPRTAPNDVLVGGMGKRFNNH